MQAIIFAFLAFFDWGVGMLFEAMVGRKMESYSAMLWGLLLGLFVSAFYAPFALKELANLTLPIFLVNLAVAFFWISGTIIYYDALKKGNPSLIGTISNAFPAVIIVLSIVFLGERPNLNQIFAIILILIGIVLASLNIRKISFEQFKKDKGAWLAIIAMISWGIALAFIKIPVREIGWFWPNFFIFALFPVVFFFQS